MSENIKALKIKSLFRMECSVTININSKPEKIWSLLTDSNNFPNWNSTIKNIDGKIALNETIKLQATVDPKRIFKLKISEFTPNKKMVWQDGFVPIFQGIRTFLLEENNNSTQFTMTEVFSGLMLPMIAGSLPDFVPIFEQYTSDLKKEAEKI